MHPHGNINNITIKTKLTVGNLNVAKTHIRRGTN